MIWGEASSCVGAWPSFQSTHAICPSHSRPEAPHALAKSDGQSLQNCLQRSSLETLPTLAISDSATDTICIIVVPAAAAAAAAATTTTAACFPCCQSQGRRLQKPGRPLQKLPRQAEPRSSSQQQQVQQEAQRPAPLPATAPQPVASRSPQWPAELAVSQQLLSCSSRGSLTGPWWPSCTQFCRLSRQPLQQP